MESVTLEGARKNMKCFSRTCNEAVRGDMGLDTLRSRRNKAKLKWWHKLVSMPEDRYLKQLYSQEWNIKPLRGRHRKTLGRVVDDTLCIDKEECLQKVEGLAASFMASIEEYSSEREYKLYDEDLNSKVKLHI